MDNIADILDNLSVFIIILGSLATAIATFVSTRNKFIETNYDVKKLDITTTAEVAEKLSSISLNISKALDDKLKECEEENKKLRDTIDEYNNYRFTVRDIIYKLKDIVEEYKKISDNNIITVNNKLESIINELLEAIK